MSAWYVLVCLGFYQMCPSRPDFTMSLPLFEKIKVKLASGRILNISRDRLTPSKMKNRVSYFEIMQGGQLEDIVLEK